MEESFDIRDALAKLVEHQDLTRQQTADVFLQVMSGKATPAQIGALLTGLRVKGETIDEIAGAAETMRSLSIKVDVTTPNLIDTCGTGGSGVKLFNISTAAAFVVAAAGAQVAKHGNRKMTSFSGSADVLEAAGVNINLTPEQIAHCIREVGVGFLFAQAHHGAMRHAGPVRQELGIRTMMNVLGPMTNPAGAKRQVVGVFSASWQRTMAEVLLRLGSEHVMIVHSDGLDELSIEGPSHIVEMQAGSIREYDITPEELGLERRSHTSLRADSPESSLRLLKTALTDTDSTAADIVALNAGAAIYVAGVATSFANGITMAQDAIASGLASERLAELVRVSSLMAEA
ncbi:MAG: anthranilate phosphoribosyltransferase [Proteobacteria bacterium]|nr:anthranilate phosphoribosyltransferase [Pseudomonadota bacterium]